MLQVYVAHFHQISFAVIDNGIKIVIGLIVIIAFINNILYFVIIYLICKTAIALMGAAGFINTIIGPYNEFGKITGRVPSLLGEIFPLVLDFSFDHIVSALL